MDLHSEWKCKSCNKSNNTNKNYCDHCGCPKTNKEFITRGWKQKIKSQKGKPTYNLMSFEFFYTGPRTSPCPSCNLHMYITEVECHHCGKKFNSFERRELINQYEITHKHGRSLGILCFPLAFILIMALLYVANNF